MRYENDDLLRSGVLPIAGPLSAVERAAVSVALPRLEGVEFWVRGHDDDEPVIWLGTTQRLIVLSPLSIGWEPAILPWRAIRDVAVHAHRWGAALRIHAGPHEYRIDGVPGASAQAFAGHVALARALVAR